MSQYPENFTTDLVASYVSSDLSTLKYKYNKTTNFDEIPVDRTDVVVIAVFQYEHPDEGRDYHFAVLLPDGEWADKPGSDPARHGNLTYNGTCWNDGSNIINDGTNTIFFYTNKRT